MKTQSQIHEMTVAIAREKISEAAATFLYIPPDDSYLSAFYSDGWTRPDIHKLGLELNGLLDQPKPSQPDTQDAAK